MITFDNSQQASEHISQELDVSTLPLSGVRLIEASAGTGKTYTITSLYVRLVLGHECTALSPEEILVVTFTRAATEELRDRIRKRLRQALNALEGDAKDDPLIAEIIAAGFFANGTDQTADKKAAGQRLKDAMQLMDLAAIYTIHGFCQRLLKQHAIESGVSDEFELSLDEGSLIQQAVRDVWRSEVYPLQGAALDLLLHNWKTPEDLFKSIRSLLHKDVDFHIGAWQGDYEKSVQALEGINKVLSELWHEQGADFIGSLAGHKEANKTFTKSLPNRQKMISACLSNFHGVKSKDAAVVNYFTIEGLKKSVKKSGTPIEHELSTVFESWFSAYEVFDASRAYASHQLLIKFLTCIRQRLHIIKQKQQVLAPDDLLVLLNDALDSDNADILLQQVRRQYPVAMVDEFQDTDEKQYRIFEQLYGSTPKETVEESEQAISTSLALFMIGDPKQAIYKFRGADIFAYISAKQKVQGIYNLKTNYRSTQNMVTGVNSVFTHHDAPFIYDKDIPFIPVDANDNAAKLILNGKEDTALSWHFHNASLLKTKPQVADVFSQGCAQRICELLNMAQQGQAVLKKGDECSAVRAKDIAVLVRSANQAKMIKEQLNDRGVGSVYVGRESIFQCEEAIAIHALLQAVHVLSERLYRNAIAHPLWCLTLEDLHELMDSERKWELELEQLYLAREVWEKQGIMAMIMFWLHQRSLPGIWLGKNNGERTLSNVVHLAELLQNASTEVQGIQGLISWLSMQISQNQGEQDQQMLRLESDANLVQIITIHKSKGLEYPIVFIPFAWDGKEAKDSLFYDESTQKLRCDLAGDFSQQIIKEGLAEEVRLFYVALTRAVSKCYVSLPTQVSGSHLLKTVNASALYYLLTKSQHVDVYGVIEETITQEKRAQEKRAQEAQNSMCSQVLEPLPQDHSYLNEPVISERLNVREFKGSLYQNWSMSSFSALVSNLHGASTHRIKYDDVVTETVTITDIIKEATEDQFSFPRGAHAGNFLHTLLEEIDFTCLPENLDELIESLLLRFSIEASWLDTSKTWLNEILAAPLKHDGLQLDQLTPSKKLVEMEFYFPVESLKAADLNALIKQYPCLNIEPKAVDFRSLKGMLKGFIDLTFEWQGQYFILDYKSNHLGDSHEDYHTDTVHAAMADHRYDIQLIIYTLALHRYLKLRLADYSYEKHIGGGYYLFLRGLSSGEGGHKYGQYFHKPEKAMIEALDALIQGEPLAVTQQEVSS